MPIARLRGIIDETGPDWVIVTVGGLGIMAQVPATTAERLTPGRPASLHTHLHVREDALTLFGFDSAADLTLFEQLISISGVGPKVALAVMGALDYGSLTRSIAGGRSDVLRKVPGIGQKTAERIVLELRDKVQPPAGGIEAPGATSEGPQPDAETVAALVGLGYTQAEASAAAAAVAADAPLEERVREALSFFART